MDGVVQAYYLKGKKSFSMTMPSEICAMTKMNVNKATTSNNILIALKNGNIRLYNEKNLINQIQTDDICNGFVFGVFGREEGCLVINHSSGGMQARILQRQAKLNVSSIKPGPPPEQDIPLKVPQKTTLFVELTQREREQGPEMHRQFQKDLCKLRLKTAQTYLGLLGDGLAPMSYAQGSQVRL